LRFEPPGSKYQYSNSDNIAVALMVEAATGKSYEDLLRELVYRPLGLKKTSLPRGTNLRKPFIHGYSSDPSQDPPEDVSEDFAAGWSWASGGIVSTPADLNAFIRAYVGGKLFDERTQAKQIRVIEGGSSEPPGPGMNSAGLALFRYETRRDGVGAHGEHLRLHPVCRRERRWEAFGDGLHQRTTHPGVRQSGGLRGAEACGGTRRVCRSGRLTESSNCFSNKRRSRSCHAPAPLFTGVRGRGILGSRYPRTCITLPL
jgi:CubicO group peptidase (beta-lactamase class C family)